ncbi:MAG: hypothetical protein EBR81_13800 [Proteobacteria bacterium]|nr:hypothetical protein [Pseudomonadota bacterium]
MGRFDFPYSELDVLAFARAMVRGGYGYSQDSDDRCESVLDIIESPHKWRTELDSWVGEGRPDSFVYESVSEDYDLTDGVQSITLA